MIHSNMFQSHEVAHVERKVLGVGEVLAILKKLNDDSLLVRQF